VSPQERLAQIRERLRLTPWPDDCHIDVASETSNVVEVIGNGEVVARAYSWGPLAERMYATTLRADFIAHAPGDLSYLLELVEAQAATIARLTEASPDGAGTHDCPVCRGTGRMRHPKMGEMFNG